MKMRCEIKKYFSMGVHEGVSEMGSDQMDQIIKSIHLKESKDTMMKGLFKKELLRAVGISMGLFFGLSPLVYAGVDEDFSALLGAMSSKIDRVGPIFSSGYSGNTERMEDLLRRKMILAHEKYSYNKQAEDLMKRAKKSLAAHKAGFKPSSGSKDGLNHELNTFDHEVMFYKGEEEKYKLGLIRLKRSDDRHEAQRIFDEHLKSQKVIEANLKFNQNQVEDIDSEVAELFSRLSKGEKEAVMRNLIGDYGDKIGLDPRIVASYKKRSDAEAVAIAAAHHAGEHCGGGVKLPSTSAVSAGAGNAADVALMALLQGARPEDRESLFSLIESKCRKSDSLAPSQLISFLIECLRGLNPSGDVKRAPVVAGRAPVQGSLGGDGDDGSEEDEDAVTAYDEGDDEDESASGTRAGASMARRTRRGSGSAVAGLPPPPPPPLHLGVPSAEVLRDYPTVVFRDQDRTLFLKASKLRGDDAGFIFTHNDGKKKDPYLVSSDGKTVLKLKGIPELESSADQATVLATVKSIAKEINDEVKFNRLFAANKKVSDWIVGDSPGTYYRVEKLDGGKYKLVGFSKDGATVIGGDQVAFKKIQAQSKKALAGEIKKLRAEDDEARSVLSTSRTMDVGASREAVALKTRITARDSALEKLSKEHQEKQKALIKRMQVADHEIKKAGSMGDEGSATIVNQTAARKVAKEEFDRNREQYRQDKGRINREASAEIDALGLALKKKKAELALHRLPAPEVNLLDDPSSSTAVDPLESKKQEIVRKVAHIENQQAFLRLKAMSKRDPGLFTEEFKTALKAQEEFSRLSNEEGKVRAKEDAKFKKKTAELSNFQEALEQAVAAAGKNLEDQGVGEVLINLAAEAKQAQRANDLPKKKELEEHIRKIREKRTHYIEVEDELNKLGEINQAKRATRAEALRIAGGRVTEGNGALVAKLTVENQVNDTPVSLDSRGPAPTIHIVGPPDRDHVVLMKKSGDEVSLAHTQVLKKEPTEHIESVPASSSSSSSPYQVGKWYQLDDGSYFHVDSVDVDGKSKGYKYTVEPPTSLGVAAKKKSS